MSCTMNFYPLGYKTPAELALNLGSKHVFKDTARNPTGGVRVPQSNIDIVAILVQNNSGGVLAPGAVVTWDTADVGRKVGIVTGAGGIGAGIVDPFLTSSVANGEYFYLIVKGRVQATAGAAISTGAIVIPAATGRLITQTLDVAGINARCGRACEAAGAAGDVRYFLVDFQV